jgi:hypothetical protein
LTMQRRIARDTRFAGDVSHELRSPPCSTPWPYCNAEAPTYPRHPRRGRTARHRPARHPRPPPCPRRPSPPRTRHRQPPRQRRTPRQRRHPSRRLPPRRPRPHRGRRQRPRCPAAVREHIFERFARGSPAHRDTTDSGAGLGLALVTQHIHRHNGTTWVEPRPGGGARFIVELPEVTK